MYADCHVHTDFSGDSQTPAKEQIERAISLGMERVCLTDHHDHDVKSDIDFELDIPAYFAEVMRLREEYADRIEVLCGIELGLQNHIAEYLDELVRRYPFDFVIGSIHYVDGIDPYFPEYFDMHGSNAYARYFEVTKQRVDRIKCFDSLGHLDYIVRYGAAHGLSYSYGEYAELIDPVLCRIISEGKALECNTGGLSRGLSEPNPCADILKRYRSLGGELITIGSDAHSPDTLGYAFKECGELLRECGFKYYTVYKCRKPIMIRLTEARS